MVQGTAVEILNIVFVRELKNSQNDREFDGSGGGHEVAV
jgi:hypothetical protein